MDTKNIFNPNYCYPESSPIQGHFLLDRACGRNIVLPGANIGNMECNFFTSNKFTELLPAIKSEVIDELPQDMERLDPRETPDNFENSFIKCSRPENSYSSLPVSDTFSSLIDGNIPEFTLNLPETNYILADLDNGTQSGFSGENNNNNLNININNNNDNTVQNRCDLLSPLNCGKVSPVLHLNNISPILKSKLTPYPSYSPHAQLYSPDSTFSQNDSESLQSSPYMYNHDSKYQLESRFPFHSSSYESSNYGDCKSYRDISEMEANTSSPTSSCSLNDDYVSSCIAPNEFSTGNESSWVREIRVGKNNRPRGPKCWEFVLRLLQDPASNPSLVKWEDPNIGSFRLVEKDRISAIWGNRPSKKKNGKVIKYESFARILRYHYKKGKGMVLPVSEKHLVYKFSTKVMEAYRAGRIL